MGTFCSKPADYKYLSRKKKDKLNSIFEEIVTKVAVDFSNPEIQDIQSAVSEMLERIKTRINERGVFSISRLEPCGSMTEKTAVWKYYYRKRTFIEFDFLAVLKAACNFEADCSECCYVKTPPVNLEKIEKYYGSLYTLRATDRGILTECFIRETSDCVASCRCLEVEYHDKYRNTYTFQPTSICSENQQGCNQCAVERHTGSLRVKTSVKIDMQCSLIFVWTSKAKTLGTRYLWCLSETESMDNLTILIDFLPALELFRPRQQSADTSASSGLVLNPTSSEYVHYCFLVLKYCTVCDKYRFSERWRRSGCLAEIYTIVNKMSDKHRKCYQILKYIIHSARNLFIGDPNSYHLKIAVLHHNSSCSDSTEDCAKCLIKVLDELENAYITRQLKSLHSQSNLLEQKVRKCKYDSVCISKLKEKFKYDSVCISKIKEKMFAAVSESDSVPAFLKIYRDGVGDFE